MGRKEKNHRKSTVLVGKDTFSQMEKTVSLKIFAKWHLYKLKILAK